MGQVWDKFVLLIWKIYKQQIRHPVQTFLELLAPVSFAIILIILRGLIPLSKHGVTTFEPFEASLPNIAKISSHIVWSPSNPILHKIVDDAIKSINTIQNFTTLSHESFKNSKQLNTYLSNELMLISTLAAVQFEDDCSDIKELKPNINITLRFPAELRSTFLSSYETWNTKYLYAGYKPGPRNEKLNEGGLPSYNAEGFLILQQELSLSIIKHLKQSQNQSDFDIPKIYLRRFPHLAWSTDSLMTEIKSSVGIIFLLSYIYTTINIVKTITYEKEKQLKEVMKIMGLPNWLHWTVWTIKFLVYLSVTSVLMVIVLETGWYPSTDLSIFTQTDPNILLVFFICFSCATVSFCFAISAFFSNASTASTFTGIIWFISYVPFYFLDRFSSRYGFVEKLASCLCTNTAMAHGFSLILNYEAAGIGMSWDNVLTFNSKNLTLGYIMIMLLFDSVLYFVISLYIGSVFPGDFGVPEKWYYPFQYSYWCGVKYEKEAGALEHFEENEHFEKEPIHLPIGVQIKGLCKQFSDGKFAVNNLHLNMYKNQISVVLGHNGAGKTTTMSMLIGMFPPTAGTAIVGGCDIRSNISGVRRSLGLCPQHNILFDDLTVCEHIYFYSRLKGLKEDEAYSEIAKYIKVLELESKANEKTSTLSGGMKRKLSVAVAFCGKSEVVILDEPTAGMDPSARRLIWDLLQTEKKGRTIVLTTHFMDEADFLGDRIAIMSKGKLQCCGSSFFLKKKYGAGYHLIIDKSNNCNVDDVTALLNRYIPNIKVGSSVGSELVYLLNEEFSKTFEEMLYDLEGNSEILGINTYGISLTTLEEVFIKVGADNATTNEESNGYKNFDVKDKELSLEESYSSQIQLTSKTKLLSGTRLWFNQVQAMFLKRFLGILRNWILLIIQILIPIVFVIFIMIIILKLDAKLDLPSLELILKEYSDPITLLSFNTNNSYYLSYSDTLTKDNNTVISLENADLNTKILEKMQESHNDVRYKYIIGATMHENQSITGWFNNVAYHSAPLSLQMILNAILHKEVSPECNIQFSNYPLSYSFLNTKLVSLLEGHTESRSLVLNISFSMAFVSSFYVLFYIKECANKSKHLQFVSGLNIMPYWIPAFILDFLTFTLTSLCLIFTMAPFQIEGFSTISEFGRLLSMLLSFGAGMLPIMYLSTFFFKNPANAYTRMTFLNVFSGSGAYLVIQIIKTSELNLGQLGKILDWIFIVFPHYSLSDGINALTTVNTMYSICNRVIDKCVGVKLPNIPSLSRLQCKILVCQIEKKCCHGTNMFYDMAPPGIGRNISVLLGVGLISTAILLCIEYKVYRNICCTLGKKIPQLIQNSAIPVPEDNDVLLEKEKVKSLSEHEVRNTGLVMQNVTKYYGTFQAVKDISLIVNPYECFGLLGVNGAGKTTTFKMMTGDINTTSGNAWVHGLSLQTDMKAIQRIIGYCPQFEALLDELTARETLVVFALIRGVSRKMTRALVEKLAKDFDFYKHLDKKVKDLSGGNKRKLSTSLALIGDPLILYLDEPTTGMDPATKRYLWNCICKVRDSGKCIVLTSHSMEECEALCTRLAIMVNGQLMCLGSTQHLKNKFSNTYTLTIKIRRTETEEPDTELIENFVRKNFENVNLREKHKDLLTFSISGKNQKWSQMFGLMEGVKMHLNIEDYSLGQGSLEQVFLRLTKYQIED